MGLPSALPRLWPTIGLPGIIDGPWTYTVVDLDDMPPIEMRLDGTLDWLLSTAAHERSLDWSRDDPTPAREPTGDGIRALAFGQRLPAAFQLFIDDPAPRRHIRSATLCYLDLGEFPIEVSDGGAVIHLLSDQQWVFHWLLYAGVDGSEAVLAASDPFGFDTGDVEPVRRIDVASPPSSLAVCSDSFEEFLFRYWAMNELFFRLAVDRVTPGELPDELRAYAARYPRSASAASLFS